MIKLQDLQSPFQMHGCIIDKIELKNDFVSIPADAQLESTVNTKNGISEIKKVNEDNMLQANLILDLQYSASFEGNTFSVHLVLNGLFTMIETNEELFQNMLLLNGNSALYSIARSYIITISSMSLTSGQLVLPMINFVNLIRESQKKQEE